MDPEAATPLGDVDDAGDELGIEERPEVAASRGLETLLLERGDFAHGTSSRSTKLVHGGVRYLQQGDVGLVIEALREPGPVFYVITNSRSLTAADAAALSREIGANLKQAMAATGMAVEVISRSDSTLRGHFPGEVDGLLAAMTAAGGRRLSGRRRRAILYM